MLQTSACWKTHCTGSCFKSPRECYKREVYRSKTWRFTRFQVPKGMLQTKMKNKSYKKKLVFQVPKGMLQTDLPNTAYLRCPTWFQVPKGMLQTKIEGVFRYWYDAVSSPQGNATNSYTDVMQWRHFLQKVSSPQGNATNTNDRIQMARISYNRCFKSPRECYKRVSTETICFDYFYVSSPQGNATNSAEVFGML